MRLRRVEICSSSFNHTFTTVRKYRPRQRRIHQTSRFSVGILPRHIRIQLHENLVSFSFFTQPSPVKRAKSNHQRTFPGLNNPNGSIVLLIVFISSTVPAPNSSYRCSFFPTPTPCSPVPSPYESSELEKSGKGGEVWRGITHKFRPGRWRDGPSDGPLRVRP